MDYLARESAPFDESLWAQIDKVVVDNAKKHMVCRRFLDLYGPLGAGTAFVTVDRSDRQEELERGLAVNKGRKVLELPQLYQDFTLYWRDLEEAQRLGRPVDLSAAAAAAQRSAKKEDLFVLYGDEKLGQEGLFNAQGSYKIKRSDWKEGEGAYRDVAHGIAYFSSHSMLGRYALILSPEIYLDLQRLQLSVGMLEIDRIAKLVDGRVYPVGNFGDGQAALVCAESQYMDLAVGVDLSVAYLELQDLNHSLRILETAALRIKEPQAIVTFQ